MVAEQLSERIDWARIAVPQADGYDTAALLALIATEPAPWRPEPLKRPQPVSPTVAKGRVSVGIGDADLLIPGPRFVPVEGVPDNLERGLAYVDCWAEAAVQWPQIVHRIQCFTDTEIPDDARAEWLGSASHSVDARFGEIAMTVDCELTAAQCIVHEMAHHKLRAMGVGNEQAIRLVTNPVSDLYESPILQRPRPMTAVLHAEYSFIHVTQLNIHMLRAEARREIRIRIRTLLRRNLVRMEKGLHVIERHMTVDHEGRAFLDAFLDWTRAVIRIGFENLDESPR